MLHSQTVSLRPDLLGGLHVPHATPHAARIPLGPVERFVLSRVDGRRTVVAIGIHVGLAEAEAHSVLARLVELGAVTFIVDDDGAGAEVMQLDECDFEQTTPDLMMVDEGPDEITRECDVVSEAGAARVTDVRGRACE